MLEYSVYKINENSSVIEYIIKYKRKIIPKKININTLYNKDEFEIKGSKIIRYKGNNKKVIIPEGITELSSCLFWDNQIIEEIILPQSLISIGGDTFYNCFNLKKINIPKNVKNIGNNPFGGCINLVINNYSSHLYYKDGVMFN